MLLRYPARGSQPLLLPLIAWIVCAAISTAAGLDPPHGAVFSRIVGDGNPLALRARAFLRRTRRRRRNFLVLLATGTLAAAAAVAMVVTRTPAPLYALAHGRATGTFVLPGELGRVSDRAAADRRRDRTARAAGAALRALAWAALAIGTASRSVLTYSRAGWIGFAAAAAFLVLMRSRRFARRRGGGRGGVGGGDRGVLLLFNSHHDPSEDYTRIAIWQAAVAIVDRFPLTGVGPFDFPQLYALVHVPDADATAFHAHSLYLTFFAELGISGLGAFLWTFWRFAPNCAGASRASSPDAALLALR